MKYDNYCDLVDKALSHSNSQHRTLRTCLDPGSEEWQSTTMEKRIEVLKKLIDSGCDLNRIFLAYKFTYREMNKNHVANNLESGLGELLIYLLIKEPVK